MMFPCISMASMDGKMLIHSFFIVLSPMIIFGKILLTMANLAVKLCESIDIVRAVYTITSMGDPLADFLCVAKL